MTETVDHELYGTGIVRARRYRGLELLVHFSCGIRRWIPRNELRAPPDRDIPPGQESALAVEPATPPAGVREREIPHDRVSALAVEPASLPAVHPGALQGAGASGAPAIPGAAPEGRIPSQIYTGRRAPPSRGKARHEARAIIEALRQGGVPREKVEHFTAGRDSELEEIREWLGSGDGCLRIDGDYGVGRATCWS